MKLKERFTKSSIILLAVGSLLPLCVLGMDIILLLTNTLFTPGYVIILILPVIALLAVWAIGLSKIKQGWKITCNCFVVLAFVVIFEAATFWGQLATLEHYSDDAAKAPYKQATENLDTMPTLDEIGKPEKLDYYYYYGVQAIFYWESDILICTYDEQEYEEQKELLDQTYVFQTEDMEAHSYACTPYAEVDGFTFRVLSFAEYELYYPKYIRMIGTNDQTNQIVYIAFDNTDLDYISRSLAEFIKEDCGWKYISKSNTSA